MLQQKLKWKSITTWGSVIEKKSKYTHHNFHKHVQAKPSYMKD